VRQLGTRQGQHMHQKSAQRIRRCASCGSEHETTCYGVGSDCALRCTLDFALETRGSDVARREAQTTSDDVRGVGWDEKR
jgi:hypothetical protein